MYRELQQDELIELGAASAETRGGPIGLLDVERTFKPDLGLSED